LLNSLFSPCGRASFGSVPSEGDGRQNDAKHPAVKRDQKLKQPGNRDEAQRP